ncbi:hypothetical protein BDZ45DRAFT_487185 [Acephala macrosclerotiorum]|nr:hypothetical protein BDZ45DRAFT_487185 [Acephala macrosclerotiorum]
MINRFRWVVCRLDILKNLGRPKAIRHALTCLPKTLDKNYNRILLSIQSDEEREILRRTLQFVIFAARPMKLKEVVEAVVIEDGNAELDPDDRFNNPEHLIKNLRSLLIITGGYLGLSHYSIQEYLQSPRIAQSPASYFAMTKATAHEEISRKCLTYLAYDDFSQVHAYRQPSSSKGSLVIPSWNMQATTGSSTPNILRSIGL